VIGTGWTTISVAAITPILAMALSFAGHSSPSKLRFEEKTIAGSATDLMIVRSIRLGGTNEQIGARLAEIARDRHGSKGDAARGDLATRQLEWLRSTWPEMTGRAAGVQSVFGSKPGDPGIDPTSLSYNMNFKPAVR